MLFEQFTPNFLIKINEYSHNKKRRNIPAFPIHIKYLTVLVDSGQSAIYGYFGTVNVRSII